jgi:nitrile hydratase subunit beta
MRGFHDLGGLPAGPIEPTDHAKTLWEKRTHALLLLLAHPSRGLVNVDELRRGIEALGEAEYNRLSYYEKWISSITNILLQKGALTPDELGRKLAEIEQREKAQECAP